MDPRQPSRSRSVSSCKRNVRRNASVAFLFGRAAGACPFESDQDTLLLTAEGTAAVAHSPHAVPSEVREPQTEAPVRAPGSQFNPAPDNYPGGSTCEFRREVARLLTADFGLRWTHLIAGAVSATVLPLARARDQALALGTGARVQSTGTVSSCLHA